MKKVATVACFALIGITALLLTGCETESVKNNDLAISPSSVGLHKDETTEFTASGGFDYTWSLQNPSWGVLSQVTGPTTVYTDRYDPGSNGNVSAIQVLTVSSSIQGANSSPNTGSSSNATTTSTNTDTIGTATAQIEHLPTSSLAGGSTNSATVTITSTLTSLTSNSTAIFTASDGTPPYTWSILPTTTSFGTLTQLSASQEQFVDQYHPSSTNGEGVTVYVIDSVGATGNLGLQLNQ